MINVRTYFLGRNFVRDTSVHNNDVFNAKANQQIIRGKYQRLKQSTK